MLRRLVFLSAMLFASPALAGPSGGSAPIGGHAQLPAPTTPPVGSSIDFDALRKGVVQVEQGGRPLAIGTVLSRDGRILTSLSGLGAATEPEVRYADGSVVKTKIGHKDKSWDLALLIPQSGHWLDGLVPTDVDPAGADLKAFLPKTGKLGALGVAFKGRTDAKSKEGDPLKSVLDIDLKGAPTIPGAPILDGNGKVVGIVVRACKDAEAKEGKPFACSPQTIAVPVYALRGFLMKTPATATIPSPWLGLGGAPSTSGSVKGVTVMGVAPGSPAEKAGLKPGENGDVIVAVDGAPVETPEQLAGVIAKHSIGQTVKFLVFSGGKFRDVSVTLKPQP